MFHKTTQNKIQPHTIGFLLLLFDFVLDVGSVTAAAAAAAATEPTGAAALTAVRFLGLSFLKKGREKT